MTFRGALAPSSLAALGRGEPNSINFFEGRRPSSLYSVILNRYAGRGAAWSEPYLAGFGGPGRWFGSNGLDSALADCNYSGSQESK